MAAELKITPDLLRQFVRYEPDTGLLFWRARGAQLVPSGCHFRARAWNTRYAGKPCFRNYAFDDYLGGVIWGKRLIAHRVAWMVYHGKEIPDGFIIDHINGKKTDNRIANLRMATQTENQHNARKKRAGPRGAWFCKHSKKWRSSIRVNLGSFKTEQEASAAYEAAAKKFRGDFYLPDGVRDG